MTFNEEHAGKYITIKNAFVCSRFINISKPEEPNDFGPDYRYLITFTFNKKNPAYLELQELGKQLKTQGFIKKDATPQCHLLSLEKEKEKVTITEDGKEKTEIVTYQAYGDFINAVYRNLETKMSNYQFIPSEYLVIRAKKKIKEYTPGQLKLPFTVVDQNNYPMSLEDIDSKIVIGARINIQIGVFSKKKIKQPYNIIRGIQYVDKGISENIAMSSAFEPLNASQMITDEFVDAIYTPGDTKVSPVDLEGTQVNFDSNKENHITIVDDDDEEIPF